MKKLMPTKLAAAALALAALSFVHLFGVDKAVIAAAIGVALLKDPATTPRGRQLAKAAVITGLIYLLVITGVFIYHMPALNSLASKLAK